MIIGKAISPFALRKKNGGGGGTDPDAQAFITATGISGTNATATNQLVIDLKAANIWTKMKGIYPMVGGTATTCKFNLKDARDLDAAYRLVFFGGGTFSSNGYLPNGTNAYADTFINSLTNLTATSTHLSYYSRTATTCKFNLKDPRDLDAAYRLTFFGGGTFSANGYQPGGVNGYANTFLIPSSAYSVANSGHMSYYSRTDSNGANEREIGSLTGTAYSDLALRYSNTVHMRWGETSVPATAASTNSIGFYVGSRTTSTSEKVFKNGTQILTSGTLGNQFPNVPFFIGAINLQGSPSGYYSAKQCAFASIGDGLTDAEVAAFRTAVQTFNTTLGRNV